MATLSDYSDDWGRRSIRRRIFRQEHGGGYEETPHRKMASHKKPHKHFGCPGNNGKSHVYVWVSQRWAPERGSTHQIDNWNPSTYLMPRWYNPERQLRYLESYEVKVCCGCGKRANRRGWRRRVTKT